MDLEDGMRASDKNYPLCLCGERIYKDLLTTIDAGKTFKVIKCVKCGLARSWPVPIAGEMHGQFYELENDAQVRLDQLSLRRHFCKKTLRLIKKYKGTGKLIDVGCNVGVLVEMALKDGYEAFGIDLSEADIQQGRDTFNLGKRLIQGSLGDIGCSDNSFDIVTYNHVFEHIPDLKNELKEIYRVLKKDGILVVEVPNFNSLWRKLLGARWYGLVFSQHIWQFSPNVLRRILENQGFHCLEVNARHSLHHEITFDLRGLIKLAVLILAYLLGEGDNLFVVAKKS